jgi:hypothetical protein
MKSSVINLRQGILIGFLNEVYINYWQKEMSGGCSPFE